MLFWMIIILLLVGIILWVVGGVRDSIGVGLTGVSLTVVGVCAVLFSVGIMIQNSVEAEAKVAKYKMRYDSLVYQYENDLYANDNDVGKRELMADIEYWNADLAYRKEMRRNFWVGIYVPNIYDEFEFIALKE